MDHFVIIGGGLAAHQAARGLLETRPQARVSMVSAERHVPYDRPHLSKGYLTGNNPAPPLLSQADIYAQNQVKLIGRTWAQQIDRRTSRVHLDNGTSLAYDRLLIATGSRARQLPADWAHVPIHYLRTFDDAQVLRGQLREGADVVIIGGGFIGLEVAAAARHRHCRVTVIEPQPHLLARTGCPALSTWVHTLHRAQGVDIQLGVSVLGVERSTCGKARVETSAGPLLADLVIAGIGVQANVELAAACGLVVGDGIEVDAACTTSDSRIFAAGEVTHYPVAHLCTRTRSESWTTASDQGNVAGRAAAGDSAAHYDEMPWLWSDQYTSNLQCLGLVGLATRYSMLGDTTADQWLALGWTKQGRLACAIAANRGRDISVLKRALKRNEPLPDIYQSAFASASTTPL